jgi:hypothetical protein
MYSEEVLPARFKMVVKNDTSKVVASSQGQPSIVYPIFAFTARLHSRFTLSVRIAMAGRAGAEQHKRRRSADPSMRC